MLTGPQFQPRRGGKPKKLVVLLHGYGSNGDDLISLAPHWAPAMPDALFVSPNAPEPVPGFAGGFQWFGLTSLDPHRMEGGARAASGPLNAFLDAQLTAHQLSPAQCALVGFSQGAMMAMYVALRREEPVAGIVAFSGALIGAGSLASQMRAKPPILIVHGVQDDRVPVAAAQSAAEALAKAGHGARVELRPRLGHSIDAEGVASARDFLAECLAPRIIP